MYDLFMTVAVIASIPAFLYAVECFSSSLYNEKNLSSTEGDAAVPAVVLIPAHNEENGIGATLESLKKQLGEQDSILVVADNCSDGTADMVRQHGCHVVERSHDVERGKGYALAHGIDQLRDEPPAIVIVVDADCDVAESTLQSLKRSVMHYDRPVQARYLIQSSPEAKLATKVSELAVMIKNRVRCKGMSALGIPVPLLGTGMAFKWQDITLVPLASGEIVEDMKLGVELAKEGRGARYSDVAVVTSAFPESDEALATQRERWEHGHLDILRRYVVPNLWHAVKTLNPKLFFFTLDLAIPPLTLLLVLHVGFIVVFFALGLFAGVLGVLQPLVFSVCLLVCALAYAWYGYGKSILTASELSSIPGYIFSKLSIYTRFINKRQTKWIRTDRGPKK